MPRATDDPSELDEDMAGTVLLERPAKPAAAPASDGEVEGTVLLDASEGPGARGGAADSMDGTVKLSADELRSKRDERPEATVMLPGGGLPADASDGTMRLEGVGASQASGAEPEATVALTMAAPVAGGTEVVARPPSVAPAARGSVPAGPRARGTGAHASASSSAHGRGGTQLAARSAATMRTEDRTMVKPAPQGGSGVWVIVLTALAVVAGVAVGLLI